MSSTRRPDARSATLTTEEVAGVLGYQCNRSVLRLVKRGLLRPLPVPRRPLHFWQSDVVALREGRVPLTDQWGD